MIPALVLVALLVLGLEVLRRQTAREFPEASRAESIRHRRQRLAGMDQPARGGTRAHTPQCEQARRSQATGSSSSSASASYAAGVLDASEFEREKAQILAAAPATAGGHG